MRMYRLGIEKQEHQDGSINATKKQEKGECQNTRRCQRTGCRPCASRNVQVGKGPLTFHNKQKSIPWVKEEEKKENCMRFMIEQVRIGIKGKVLTFQTGEPRPHQDGQCLKDGEKIKSKKGGEKEGKKRGRGGNGVLGGLERLDEKEEGGVP